MMAYVTLEDDTAAIEMLAFSNVLSQYGGYLKENGAVVVVGRVSFREEKEPQMVINRVRPLSDYAEGTQNPADTPQPTASGRLYLRLPSETVPEYRKVRAMLGMFPGQSPVTLYFSDTRLRRGSVCMPQADLLQALSRLLGAENVILK